MARRDLGNRASPVNQAHIKRPLGGINLGGECGGGQSDLGEGGGVYKYFMP